MKNIFLSIVLAASAAGAGIRIDVTSDPKLPAPNLIDGKNPDGTQGPKFFEAGVKGKANCHATFKPKTFKPGVRYVASCRIKPDKDVISLKTNSSGLGFEMSFVRPGWKLVTMSARGGFPMPDEWNTVYSDPVTMPEGTTDWFRDVGFRNNPKGTGWVDDLRVTVADATLSVRVSGPRPIRQVKVVNAAGDRMFDSGVLTGEAKTFEKTLVVNAAGTYTAMAVDDEGDVAAVTYPEPTKTRAGSPADVQEFCTPFVEGQVHASTVLPLKGDGEYLVCWFQGTKEGADDVAVWGSRRICGRWEKTRKIAKVREIAHWNPVLYRGQDGRIVLFFKVGKSIDDWQTFFVESRDEGQAWSEPRELVSGDTSGGRGPVKNKCLRLKSGRLLAPASRERGPWRAFIDISDDDGRTWRAAPGMKVPDIRLKTGKPFGVIQPSLWQSDDGSVHAFLRSNAGRIYRSDSADDGETWSEVRDTGLPNNNSGIDLVRTSNGRLFMAMNVSDVDWGPRTCLDLRVSGDDGATWKPFRTLIDRRPGTSARDVDEYSYPAVIEPRPGKLAITYTFNRKTIRFVEIDTQDALTPSSEGVAGRGAF